MIIPKKAWVLALKSEKVEWEKREVGWQPFEQDVFSIESFKPWNHVPPILPATLLSNKH